MIYMFASVLSILVSHDSDHDDLRTLNTDRYLFSFSLLGLRMCCTCSFYYDMVSLFLFQHEKGHSDPGNLYSPSSLSQWHVHLQPSSWSNLRSERSQVSEKPSGFFVDSEVEAISWVVIMNIIFQVVSYVQISAYTPASFRIWTRPSGFLSLSNSHKDSVESVHHTSHQRVT